MEMRVSYKSDLSIINEWQLKRSLPLSSHETLPQNGVMVFDDNEYIAAGFLRICEGKVALIDSVITNPDASLKKRSESIDNIFEALLNMAKLANIKNVIGFSTYRGMVNKSKKFNFKESKYKLMTLSLGE